CALSGMTTWRRSPRLPTQPENLGESQGDFDQDQHDDDELEAAGAVGVLQVDQGGRRRADEAELAVEGLGALDQLVLVLEPAVEALEVRALPEDVGLFAHGDAAGYAMLHQQRLADHLQDGAAAAGRSAPRRQSRRERLQRIEHGRDLA